MNISFANTSPTVIYTDACGMGYIGAAISHRGSQYAPHTHFPEWISEGAGIYEFDTDGGLRGTFRAAEIDRETPPLIFRNTRRTARAVIRADSRTPSGRAVRSARWGAAAAAGCSIWIVRVESPLNLSDRPPRRYALLGNIEKTPDIRTSVRLIRSRSRSEVAIDCALRSRVTEALQGITPSVWNCD